MKLILIFLLLFSLTANAEEEGKILGEGGCEYNKHIYYCFLLKHKLEYHIILEKDTKVIAVYELTKNGSKIEIKLVWEWGDEI